MFYIIFSKTVENHLGESYMIKKLLIGFLTLLLAGCSSNKNSTVENAFIFSTNNVLSREDAQEAYDFFERTVKEGASETAKIESYSGDYQIPVFFVINHKEKSYQFQLEYMIVVDENHHITGRYLINDDYYRDVFYPYLSKLFDKYGPTFLQVLNVKNGVVKARIKSPEWEKELVDLEMIDLFGLTELISLKYSSADIYFGNYSNPRYILEIDDGIVNEKVYFIDNYAIVNDRRIELPADYDVDSLFEILHNGYTYDEVESVNSE